MPSVSPAVDLLGSVAARSGPARPGPTRVGSGGTGRRRAAQRRSRAHRPRRSSRGRLGSVRGRRQPARYPCDSLNSEFRMGSSPRVRRTFRIANSESRRSPLIRPRTLRGCGRIHSGERIPKNELRTPYFEFRTPYSVFRIPYSVLRIPYSVLRIPYSVLRMGSSPRVRRTFRIANSESRRSPPILSRTLSPTAAVGGSDPFRDRLFLQQALA